jgi:hypothetical protein
MSRVCCSGGQQQISPTGVRSGSGTAVGNVPTNPSVSGANPISVSRPILSGKFCSRCFSFWAIVIVAILIFFALRKEK